MILIIMLLLILFMYELNVERFNQLNPFKNKLLINIGKCGGTSINRQLKDYNINIKSIHVKTIKFNPNIEYIIIIRNPLERFISSYNWRKRLILYKDNLPFTSLFPSEKKIFKKYKSLNDLVENIYLSGKLYIDFKDKQNYIHHIYEDINYYLKDLLPKVSKDKIKVITQEFINDDFKKIFNKNLNKTSLSTNEKKDKYLSELGLKNIKKWLKKDYECIEKLNDLGVLNKKQYAALIK